MIRITEINPEEVSIQGELKRCSQFLMMPFSHAKGFTDKVNHMFDKIEELLNKKDNVQQNFKNSNGLITDPNNMNYAIDQMKTMLVKSQKLEEQRCQFASNMYSIIEKN